MDSIRGLFHYAIRLAWVAAIVLAGCSRDKGDPEKISRDFIVSIWTQNVQRVNALTCQDWRSSTTEWAQQGDPGLSIDTNQLEFQITDEADEMITVHMSGVVTIKSAAGDTEVRDFNELGAIRFILVDEDGWKVCDVREQPPD
jgi:hypothetical protein